MGSRHFGELLLHPSPLRTFSVAQTSTPSWRRTTSLCLSRRTLHTASPTQSAQPQPQQGPESESESQTPTSSQAQPTSQEQLGRALEDLFPPSRRSQNQRSATTRTVDALFKSSGVGSNLSSRPPPSYQTTSSDEFSAAARGHQFGLNFSPKPNANVKPTPFRPKGLNVDNMTFPTSDDLFEASSQTPALPEREPIYPRLNASTGRTVNLDPGRGRDIVRGLKMLATLMARNRVRADSIKQKFHERAGLKRKRLKSERWRARFKTGFDNTCKRVTDLTRKGW